MPDRLTPEREAEIRKREAAATKGVWVSMYTHDSVGPVVCVGDDVHAGTNTICETPGGDDREADFEFISHAREDIPTLLAEIDYLRRLAGIEKQDERIGGAQ